MLLNKYTLIALIIFCGISCAGVVLGLRNFADREYHFCDAREVTPNAGKVCYRWCTKTSFFGGNCLNYSLIVEDLSQQSVHDKFLYAKFLLIPESRLQSK
jgi:hypothetical protein